MKLCMILLGCIFWQQLYSQEIAVKSNLLYDAAANVNVGAELGLTSRWTLDLTADFNAWTLSGDRKWKHVIFQPEARYWFCDRFAGHFLGAHLHAGIFNVGGLTNSWKLLNSDFSQLSGQRFEGWLLGAGVAYGYTWILGRHWNLEAEIGIGYAFTRYDRYECVGCGKKTSDHKQSHHYFGPTKAALNLVYLF